MRRARLVASAAAVLAGVALAGCSGPKLTDPLEIGNLPAEVGAPINLAGEVAETGALVEWPNACDLLTDEVITSLLPQAESITRKPSSRGFRFHAPGNPYSAEGTEVDIQNARCDVEFGFPLGMMENGVNKARFVVGVEYAGSPEGFALNYKPDESKKIDVPGGACERKSPGPSTYTCANASKQVLFTVDLFLPHHGPSLKDASRYTHDGETVTFSTKDEENGERVAYLDKNVTLPAMEAILTRLKG